LKALLVSTGKMSLTSTKPGPMEPMAELADEARRE
jgi:hypothetical protein